MEHDVDGLRAKVAELRSKVTGRRRSTPRQAEPARVSRRRMLTGLAGLGAAGTAAVVTARPAAAADGGSLVLGEENTATSMTTLTGSTFGAGFSGLVLIEQEGTGEGLTVVGQQSDYAIVGLGGLFGVTGLGDIGVEGYSSEQAGLSGVGTQNAIGLQTSSDLAPAITATSASSVQLVLTPSNAAGPPSPGTVAPRGSFYVDDDCVVWLCTQDGATPTWTRMLREDNTHGRTVPISPIRAIDTRASGGRSNGAPAVPGQKAGPLKGGTSLTLDLAGAGPIPAGATGVIGNLAAISPNYSGYLAARPSGTTATTSSLNFPQGVTAIANAFTSQLGPDGLTISGSGTSANTYHLVVDITAYIT